ncbi:MAG TPA: aminotransferase class I/II-fold pyridoxal phosphate-dependent enzyme [Polyangiaceae bacterium]
MGTVARTVYGVYYPETRRIVDALWAERPHGWYERNYTGRQDDMHVPFFEQWRAWAAGGGVMLGSSFTHAYPTAGANEGIHALLALHAAHGGRRIHAFAGEYEGYGYTARALGLEVVTHERDPDAHRLSIVRSARPGDVFWISQPSAIDGDVWPGFDAFLAWMGERAPETRVVVDLTYVGAVAVERRIDVDHPCVQALVFSLSKPFGVYYHRIGGLLARAEVPTLRGHLWFKNLFSVHLGERLLRAHPARDLPARYLHLQSETLARALRAGEVPPGARPSDVVLLAHAPGPAGTFTEYARGDGLRFCLSPGMDGALNP